jgi:hypothetical protein
MECKNPLPMQYSEPDADVKAQNRMLYFLAHHQENHPFG